MTHAALKCFLLFGLSNDINPLDSLLCHNLFEAARRDKPVSVKRRLYPLRLLRVLLISLLVLLLILRTYVLLASAR